MQYRDKSQERRLAELIRHMRAIDDYRQTFDRLQASWDTLTLLGQLSGGATEMGGTRTAFSTLTGDLLGHLAVATRDKAVTELRTKAQNAIDVLVRNLFERTADIGFLAADTDIREFLETDPGDATGRGAIEARFRAYVAKYSVYADIVLVDCAGTVRARLGDHPADVVRHPVVAEALGSAGAYVEYYGAADFVSEADELLYAWRIEGQGGRPLGVLILVFRLVDEMAGIFRKLLPDVDWTVLGCVTEQGAVVAGSCPLQLPRGLSVAMTSLEGEAPLLRLGGRRYLAVACRPAPYQGYEGPGWLGLGLVPLEAAFDHGDAAVGADVDEDMLAAVASQSELFPPALRVVSRQAAAIQSNLNRAVWNGSIRQAGSAHANAAFSKILLWEISDAGRKTQAACDASIRELHRTVVAAMLDKCRSRAALAIDVMDRNLYERANDCRWWALNATFARALAAPSAEAARLCGQILAKINALYTVYTNLILFDAHGTVVAVSRPDQAHWVGRRLEEEWVGRTLGLRSGQHYVVSEFEPSPLYGDAATLIYTAAVQGDAGRAAGGIAIVFDATPQFAAILEDCLPSDEAGRPLPGAFALLVGRDGRVLSATGGEFPIGAPSPFAIDPVALARDGDMAVILSFEGRHLALGAAFSKGYREYRTSDGYEPDVMAICAVPLGEAATVDGRLQPHAAAAGHAQLAPRRPDGADTFEVATFHIGRHWLGVGAGQVVEAVDLADLKPSAREASDGLLAGYKLHEGEPVPVLRLDRLLGFEAEGSEGRQIVIVKAAERVFGLVVDALGPIPEITESEVQPLREMGSRFDVPARGIVASDSVSASDRGMLLLLDAERLGVRLDTEARHLVQAAE